MRVATRLFQSLLAVTSITFLAQSQSPVARFSIVQPAKSFHVGDLVRLEMTIKNVSGGDVVFRGGPPRGEYMLEWFDTSDPSGKDLALPSRQRADRDINIISASDYFTIHSGETAKDTVVFTVTSELAPHPGRYRVIVQRREWVNNVVVRSNPLLIEIKRN
jgi:hypothetical protein